MNVLISAPNVTSEMTKWLRKGGANISFAHSKQNYPTSSDTKTSNVINAGRTMPGFLSLSIRVNADGTYKLDTEGRRIHGFGSYRSFRANDGELEPCRPHCLNDKSERMRDEVSGPYIP